MSAPATPLGWTAIAVRMQRRASAAWIGGGLRLSLSYCRRRDFCARMAQRLGGRPWGTIDREAGRVLA